MPKAEWIGVRVPERSGGPTPLFLFLYIFLVYFLLWMRYQKCNHVHRKCNRVDRKCNHF